MKILHIHKYYGQQLGGGSVTSFFETRALLERKGHQSMVFSMQDEKNDPSPYSRFFIERFNVNEPRGLLAKARLVPRVIWNREAADRLDALLRQERPDVAHLHNFYNYITPSILPVLRRHGIPSVHKLSNYKLLCPNYQLFTQGEVCERCRGHRYYQAVRHRCVKDSHAASLVAALDAYLHHWLGSYRAIDLFIAPSEFMRRKAIEFGMPADRLVLLRNVFDFSRMTPVLKKRDYFLYMGRLADGKGLDDLLQAMALMQRDDRLRGHRLKIAGRGPDEARLRDLTERLGLADVVEFCGFVGKGSEAWIELLQQARFSVLPAQWYDNSPNAVSESMAFATPVIVSDRGGSKEQLEHGVSGLVFAAHQVEELAACMTRLLDDPDACAAMGGRALARVRELNDEENYYRGLMAIYGRLTGRRADS